MVRYGNGNAETRRRVKILLGRPSRLLPHFRRSRNRRRRGGEEPSFGESDQERDPVERALRRSVIREHVFQR